MRAIANRRKSPRNPSQTPRESRSSADGAYILTRMNRRDWLQVLALWMLFNVSLTGLAYMLGGGPW